MSSLEGLIEEYGRAVEEKIVEAEAAKKKLDQLIELQKIKNKRLKGEPLSDEEIQRAMSLLCWNSYAGCCAPAKDCPWNIAVSDALGVDYKELYEAKMKTIEEELKKMLVKKVNFESELNFKLLAEDYDCTFNAQFYFHLVNLGVKIEDTTVDDIKKLRSFRDV